MGTLIALLLAGAASPALAQEDRGQKAADPAPEIPCAPEHAAMGHCTTAPAQT